ncbi:MAG: hypothetical protein Q7I98_09175, partial [Erysipelotrichaceae bacterium]|nr:hypothetical protein [Erysipelotrichaceae bacterium]
KAFADRNFHCGYYIDGDELNEIISFRQDTLETYYNYLRGHVSFFQKQMSTIFSYFIISHLNQKSEPRIALKSNNMDLIKKYFR